MKYAFAVLAFAIGVFAGDATVTDVVTAYTTYCPEATTLSHGSWTYTASASETVTVPAHTVTSSSAVKTPSSTLLYTSCPPSSSGVSTGSPSSSAPESGAPYPTTTYSNPLTVIYSTGAAVPTGSSVGAASPSGSSTGVKVPFAGAASSNKVAAGAIVGALAGVVAMAL